MINEKVIIAGFGLVGWLFIRIFSIPQKLVVKEYNNVMNEKNNELFALEIKKIVEYKMSTHYFLASVVIIIVPISSTLTTCF